MDEKQYKKQLIKEILELYKQLSEKNKNKFSPSIRENSKTI